MGISDGEYLTVGELLDVLSQFDRSSLLRISIDVSRDDSVEEAGRRAFGEVYEDFIQTIGGEVTICLAGEMNDEQEAFRNSR